MATTEPVEVGLDEAIARAACLAVPGRRRILGIVGAPGAGKSTLAEQLVRALGSERAVLVPMDGYHLANTVLEDLGRRDRKGAVDTFDDAGFASLLERLHAQRPDAVEIIYAPHFRRDLEEPIGSAQPVPGHIPLVITEGNYLLQDSGAWPRVRACLDEAWFIAPDEPLRHARLIERHERYGKSAAEARRWALGSDQRNAELIEASAARADWIIRIR
ncbi:nucleoside/nucleotide kinase family protein [Arthrobacter sp. I2-34]|uniref:Nucleoside/nucleotide kinase family protein n=1 Tax=Arthrobacter hankyongi TaxID=2904801 RepID=A0ABS9L746_9MICC|nr:nucleoside/nucleotide kinase family protein [Arthrobacter hankyongi]MCG2622493.1 nucleoside/nucleotide kinase family protein [Arthrobacter hankyongi]